MYLSGPSKFWSWVKLLPDKPDILSTLIESKRLKTFSALFIVDYSHISGDPVLQLLSLRVRLPRLSLFATRSSLGTLCSRRVTPGCLCSSWDRCSILLYTCRTAQQDSQDCNVMWIIITAKLMLWMFSMQIKREWRSFMTLLKRGEQDEKRWISKGSSSLVSSSSYDCTWW